MHKVTIGTKEYKFTASWNELTKDELYQLAHFLSMGISREKIVVYWIQFKTKLSFKEITKIHPDIFVDLDKISEFIFGKITLSKQIIPYFHYKRKKFIGPSDALTSLTFWQFFAYTETYFSKYIETKKEKYLDILVTSLYCSSVKFDEDMVKLDAKIIRKMPQFVKQAVLLFYIGSKNFIASKYPELFKTSKPAVKSDGLDVVKLIDSLNREDLSKNELLKNANLYEALERMTKNIEKSNELKKLKFKK